MAASIMEPGFGLGEPGSRAASPTEPHVRRAMPGLIGRPAAGRCAKPSKWFGLVKIGHGSSLLLQHCRRWAMHRPSS